MLLNRRYIRASLQALLVLLAFASCINDNFADDATRVDSDDTPWYLSLQLQFDTSGSSTRATGDTYEPGTHKEHEIGPKGNYVILFDGNDNLFGIYSLTMTVQDKVHNDTPNDEIQEGDYLRLVHVYSRNGTLPASCLVVLNASDDFCKKLDEYDRKRFDATLSEVLKEVWYDAKLLAENEKKPEDIGFADSEHKYFTMTNSIYLDGTNKKVDVVSVKNNIYPTIQEAINNPTTVYVERMVAKMSFEKGKDARTDEYGYYMLRDTWNDSGDIQPDLTSDEQVWLYDGYDESDNAKDPDDPKDFGNLKIKNITTFCRMQVTGWGFNALETESHFFKKIESKQYFDGYSWSDAAKHRSYWSEDPHYAESYPWQYRYAVDNRTIGYYSDEHYPSPLKNYSYDKFYKGLGVNGDVVYIPENTYGEDVLEADYDGRTNLLAGTHLIVCAELLVDNAVKEAEEGESITPQNKYTTINLYRDRIGVYYKNRVDCLAELVRQFNHDLKSQSTMKFYYYDWKVNSAHSGTADENDNTKFTAKCTGDYQLYYGDEVLTPAKVRDLAGGADITLSTAYIKDGDGKLLPWTDGWINNLTIRNSEGEQLKIYDGDYDLAEEELKEHNNTYNKDKEGFKYQELKKPVREYATTNDIKSLLLEWVGAIDHFNEGKMYYAAPVLHNAASNPNTANMQKLGDFGFVLNLLY